jgi:hypothetical protein
MSLLVCFQTVSLAQRELPSFYQVELLIKLAKKIATLVLDVYVVSAWRA